MRFVCIKATNVQPEAKALAMGVMVALIDEEATIEGDRV
jgi:hypothetical protein